MDEEGYRTKIVFRTWPGFVVGLLVLLGMAALSARVLDGAAPMFDVLIWFSIILIPAMLCVWLMGMVTTIKFGQYSENMTVTLAHIPLFLWFLRVTGCPRKKQGRFVFVP